MPVFLFLIALACSLGIPFTAAAAEPDPVALSAALHAAEQGRFDKAQRQAWSAHPLLPWLDALQAARHLNQRRVDRMQRLLQRHGDTPAMHWLRERWLAELARRQDWKNFIAADTGLGTTELRCHALHARMATGAADWQALARQQWLQGGSLPAACDVPFRALAQAGGIDANLRWQRIDLAAEAGNTGLMRHLGKGLPAEDAARALAYANYLDAPSIHVGHWPKDARSQRIAVLGLRRLAQRDPGQAEALLPATTTLALSEAQRGEVQHAIALWTVASYLPEATRRLAAVPAVAYDTRLYEWRVREALARGNDRDALAAIEAMPPAQRGEARWQYFEARLRERGKQSTEARALYAKAATSPTFHGFLAADRLQWPYALCPLEPATDPARRARVAALPGLHRALILFELERPGYAEREWNALLAGLDDSDRLLAIELAQAAHWYDRAVFSLGSAPEHQRQYRLRFPLHHTRTLRREAARHGLDPAWVAGLTRAESAFMPKARSHADARGLMQLIPSTAAAAAKRLGRPWRGATSLFQPVTNLILGTSQLRHELDQHGGLPYLAVAAYNAGPSPVARWRQARAALDFDFWIETVNYGETRDYIARVMAFSVIYDWRMNGRATPLTDRLLGRRVADSARRDFHCPTANAGSPP